MEFKQYITESSRTDFDLKESNNLHWQLGLFNEFGELIGPIKKSLFPDKIVDVNRLTDELGDVAFYLAKACRLLGFEIPFSYAYEEQNNIIDIINSFNESWSKKDLMGIFCTLQNFCYLYNIDFEEALERNIAKLEVRHPNGFNINNPKHTKEEQDAIK
jgi:NTP pyrophosphatase (non-canonical NTP hydrolase)